MTPCTRLFWQGMTTVLSRQCNWAGLSCYKTDVPVLKFKSQVNLIFWESSSREFKLSTETSGNPTSRQTSFRAYALIFFLFLARQPPVGHGQVIHEVFRSHTTHHSRWDSSGRVINSSRRPLPVNTQHSQQRDIHTPVGLEPTISAGDRPQIHTLDHAATGTGMP